MKDIKMIDLKSQYKKFKTEYQSSINEVLDSAAYIKGNDVIQFQEEFKVYLGVNHVITCANGTDALQIGLMALGIKPGDEVITTGFTFIASVEVLALLGITIKLVDVEKDTYNIDPDKIEEAVTSKTKAIIPVHLFGQSANMEKIMKIAQKYNLFVIEDTAQAIGCNFTFSDKLVKKAGTIGNIGTTSFFPTKNLNCFGDGGALFANDDNLAKRIESIANHGMTIRYYHDEIGINSRLDSIQAAILRINLKNLDIQNKIRQEIAEMYNLAFNSIDTFITPLNPGFTTHVYHQYTVCVRNKDRNKIKIYLESNGIPTMLYYPVPIHLQKAYKYLGYKQGDFPVTEQLCNTVISLPINPDLEKEQINFIIKKIIEYKE